MPTMSCSQPFVCRRTRWSRYLIVIMLSVLLLSFCSPTVCETEEVSVDDNEEIQDIVEGQDEQVEEYEYEDGEEEEEEEEYEDEEEEEGDEAEIEDAVVEDPFADLPVLHISESNKNEVLSDESGYWMIYFFTPWCKACMEKASYEYAAAITAVVNPDDEDTTIDVKFAAINCTESPNLCSRFNQKSYPSFVMFHQNEYAPFLGNRDEYEIAAFVLEKAKTSLFLRLNPQSSIFLIWLEKTEAVLSSARLHDDDDINSALIGLLLGTALLLPSVLLYALVYLLLLIRDKVFGEPTYGTQSPQRAPSQQNTPVKKDGKAKKNE